MSRSYDLPSAEVVTIGTIGSPGERVFLLQASLGPERLTLKLEKQHAAALAAAIGELLADLPMTPTPIVDPGLEKPFDPDWAVGTLGLSPLDEATGRATLIAEELVRDEGAVAATASIGLSGAQLAFLGLRAAELVTSGRPNCELCGFPIDPSGHSCPKTNGHLKR